MPAQLSAHDIMKLSTSWARKYSAKIYVEFDEIVSIINLAICEGLNTYQVGHRTLIQHLMTHVSDAISQAIRRNQTTQMSRNENELRLHLLDYQEEYLKTFGRQVSMTELQTVAKRKTKKTYDIHQLEYLLADTFSLNDEETGEFLNRLVSDELNPEESMERKQGLHRLTILNPKEREVIQLIFGIECEPLEIKVIARELHLTVHQVNQIQIAAMRKMRVFPKV